MWQGGAEARLKPRPSTGVQTPEDLRVAVSVVARPGSVGGDLRLAGEDLGSEMHLPRNI